MTDNITATENPHPNPPPEYRGRGKNSLRRCGVMIAAVLALCPALVRADAASTTAPAPAFQYVKKATRAETEAASILANVGTDIQLGPWWRVGPFDAAVGHIEDRQPPETTDFDPNAVFDGKAGLKVKWEQTSFADGVVNDLRAYKSPDGTDAIDDNAAVYLYREITCKKPHNLHVTTGSDDGIRVWLNGKSVLEVDKTRACHLGDDKLTLPLAKGVNRLLMKITNGGGPWAYAFAIGAADERVNARLQYQLDSDFPASGEDRYYRILTVPLPDDVVLEVGGMTVLPDGRIACCTRRGEIWIADTGAYGKPPLDTNFKLFASGLHEPLGLVYRDGAFYCAQRPELTRIRDTDGDGRADLFETVCNDWPLSGDYHEFAFGPKFDRNGDMWVTLNVGFAKGIPAGSFVPWRGWAVKITKDGKLHPVATGLRSPAGLTMGPDGDIYFSDNQGDWVATNVLQHLDAGAFYMHAAGLKWVNDPQSPVKDPGPAPKGRTIPEAAKVYPIHLPIVWFPYGEAMGQAATDVVFDETVGKFGPFAGQAFVGDEDGALINRVCMEKVDGQLQGACFPFRSGFECGIIRLAWAVNDPTDPSANASLFVGMSNRGWGSRGNKPYGLQRLLWTGRMPFEMKEIHAKTDGFDVNFTKPIDPATGADVASYKMQSWTYTYGPQYGSPEVDKKPVKVTAVTVAPDRLSVRITADGLKAGYVHELNLSGVKSADGESLLHASGFYTLNHIPGVPTTAPADPPTTRPQEAARDAAKDAHE